MNLELNKVKDRKEKFEKKYYNLEVFYFGKYFEDLTTCSQFNRVRNTSKDSTNFSSKDFKEVLKYNKLNFNNEKLLQLKKKLIDDFCVSVDIDRNGSSYQVIIILKKF